LTTPTASRHAASPDPIAPPTEPRGVDPDLPARAGVVIAVVAVLVQTVAHLVNGLVYDLEIWSLRADLDANVFAWASSAATLVCACALLLLAALRPAEARLLLFLAAATAFLSADDIGQIHEQVGAVARRIYSDVGELGAMIWPVVFLPLLLATVVGLVRVLRPESHAARRVGFAGLALLGAAVLMDGLWPLFYEAGGERESTADIIEDAFEEGLELGGWILVASGLAAVALRAAAVRPGAGAAR
jgi:hypothetical protein